MMLAGAVLDVQSASNQLQTRTGGPHNLQLDGRQRPKVQLSPFRQSDDAIAADGAEP